MIEIWKGTEALSVIGVGVIGCGMIAKVRHAPEYAQNSDCRIVGFYDPDRERAEALAAVYGARAFDNLEAVLECKEIDAVSVCTSNDTHARIAIQALQAGKHVLCEKPMAMNVQEAEAMVEAARSNGRQLMIGHNQRLAPAHRMAKELLDSGKLGRALSFQTTFAHGGPENWLKDRNAKQIWFFDKRKLPAGVLADLGIHKIDLLCWLLGDEVSEVRAITGTRDKMGTDGEPVEVPDTAALVMRFRRGAIGTLFCGWTSYGAEDNSTVIYCQNGVLQIYRDEAQIRWIHSDGNVENFSPGEIQTNENQTCSGVIDLFLRGIREGKSYISGEDGLRAMRIVQEAMAQ